MKIHDLRTAASDDLHDWLEATRSIALAEPDGKVRRLEATSAAQACLALRECLASISNIHDGGSCESILIRGLPIAPKSDEPLDDSVNNLLLLGAIEAADMSVFSYRQQMEGSLIQNVRPMPGKELTSTNAGRIPLGWHTDEASFRPQYRAEAIALLCINNAAGAATKYTDASRVVARLEPSIVKILTEHRFRFSVPESFTVFGGKLIYTEPRPVLTEIFTGVFEVAGADTSTIAVRRDDEAANALFEFWDAVEAEHGDEVKLESGDLLVISNLRGLHARSAVTGSRHLKRAYFRFSLQALRDAGHNDVSENIFSCEDFVLS